jgi:hypothetical protein
MVVAEKEGFQVAFFAFPFPSQGGGLMNYYLLRFLPSIASGKKGVME